MQFHHWFTMLMPEKRARDASLMAKEYNEDSTCQWALATQALTIKYFLLLQLRGGRQPVSVLEDSLWIPPTNFSNRNREMGKGSLTLTKKVCYCSFAKHWPRPSIIHGVYGFMDQFSWALNCSWKGRCISELCDNHVKGEVSWQNSLSVCRAVKWYLLQIAENAKERHCS